MFQGLSYGTHNILLTRKQVLLYNYCIIPRTYEEIVFYAINNNIYPLRNIYIGKVIIIDWTVIFILLRCGNNLNLVAERALQGCDFMYMRKGIKKTNNVFDGTHNILLTRKQVLLYNYCIIFDIDNPMCFDCFL